MGYYTKYRVDVSRETGAWMDAINEHGTSEAVIAEDVGYDPFDESCKWYYHDDDMLKVSKKFSGVLFKVSGEGEESGDMWRSYYLDGKMQNCKAIVSYPDFNENELR